MFELPIVSIAIPIFNASKYLERCLCSVYSQSYNNIEYVIVNDGSIDSSIDVFNRVTEKYPDVAKRVLFIDRKENKGIAYTRNELIENCHGDFITFVDADDFLNADIIEKLVKVQINTNADIVSSGFFIHKTKEEIPVPSPNQFGEKWDMFDYLTTQGLHHELFCRIIRRELFVKYNLSFANGLNIGEDWLLLVKLAFYANIVACIDDIGYHYNCENVESAMASLRNQYLKKQIEDLKVLSEMARFFAMVECRVNDDFYYYYARKLYGAKMESIKANSATDYEILCLIQKEFSETVIKVKLDWRLKVQKFLSKSFSLSRKLLKIKSFIS